MLNLRLPFRAEGLGRRSLTLAIVTLLLLLPQFVLAAGGENIRLKFEGTDNYFLYASLLFGVIALVFGLWFRKWVLSQSAGPESMQTVGQAIIDGANAYLQQQIRSMSIFIVIIAAVLFGMYYNAYGPVTSAFVAVCFVAGVLASYVAGYVGMGMAVRANMRTAFAALTSYSNSLQIAFRAGAVAGLVTVGMGLIGATLILMLAGGEAMKLLVGFGFGGSLAALFMRVGGGIYTKAADVGADLVGKVEAGIPEDDPRNPAVIADNVGDNVGDCAGMAADVFESYEVTLVAAIILGAATAAIFDQDTWTKLILFALMARGVGIIASIIGMFLVKAKEDETDPLKPISKGYYASLAAAAVLTVALGAFFMQGIKTNILTTAEEASTANVVPAAEAVQRVAKSLNVPKEFVSAQAVMNDELFKAQLPAETDRDEALNAVLNPTRMAERGMEGFTKVEFSDPDNPVMKLAVPVASPSPSADPSQPEVTDFKTRYERSNFKVWGVEVEFPEEGRKQTVFFGPGPADTGKASIEEFLGQAMQQSPGIKATVLDKVYDVEFYANAQNEVVIAVVAPRGEVAPARVRPIPQTAANPQGGQPPTFFNVKLADHKAVTEKNAPEQKAFTDKQTELGPKISDANTKLAAARTAKNQAEIDKLTAELKALNDQLKAAQPKTQLPFPKPMQVVTVEHKDVPWFKFVLCIIFGIIMAVAFEKLTDYYVSMHKRPVREVTEVATTGPAPMIITGFAYGKESSVFSVVAIVICLFAPLVIFPPAEYGGYLLSFYGIALVGLGLLTTTGYILAMDTFGPISDNAQGVFEMSGEGHDNAKAARSVQLLDAAGNTTKALTKGFAIATAVVAAVALFHAFVESGKIAEAGLRLEIPEIFLGLLIGGAAPYLFAAFSINAVGRAAFQLINEVRRQFREDAGIMAGTSKPDYARCVAIVTAAAQKELIGPGILAICLPVLVAFSFSIGKETTLVNGIAVNLTGAQALGGFLAGVIVSGQLLAVMLANSGGMWDNCKKLIEDGMLGGKGTEAHKAAVVCDTVGDPFKDTAGPALNPLIKVMNLVALIIVPIVILPLGNMVYIGVSVVALAAIVWAIYQSKKGSMSSELASAVASEPAAKMDDKDNDKPTTVA